MLIKQYDRLIEQPFHTHLGLLVKLGFPTDKARQWMREVHEWMERDLKPELDQAIRTLQSALDK